MTSTKHKSLKNCCKYDYYDETVEKKSSYMFNVIFEQITSLLSKGYDIIISTQDKRIMEYWTDKLLVFSLSKKEVTEIEQIQQFF